MSNYATATGIMAGLETLSSIGKGIMIGTEWKEKREDRQRRMEKEEALFDIQEQERARNQSFRKVDIMIKSGYTPGFPEDIDALTKIFTTDPKDINKVLIPEGLTREDMYNLRPASSEVQQHTGIPLYYQLEPSGQAAIEAHGLKLRDVGKLLTDKELEKEDLAVQLQKSGLRENYIQEYGTRLKTSNDAIRNLQGIIQELTTDVVTDPKAAKLAVKNAKRAAVVSINTVTQDIVPFSKLDDVMVRNTYPSLRGLGAMTKLMQQKVTGEEFEVRLDQALAKDIHSYTKRLRRYYEKNFEEFKMDRNTGEDIPDLVYRLVTDFSTKWRLPALEMYKLLSTDPELKVEDKTDPGVGVNRDYGKAFNKNKPRKLFGLF